MKLSSLLLRKLNCKVADQTALQCRMVCTFALHICQYDKNMPSSRVDWIILVEFSLYMRKRLLRGLFEIVIVFV